MENALHNLRTDTSSSLILHLQNLHEMLSDTGVTKDKPNRNRDQTSEEEGQGQTRQKRGRGR